MALDRVATVRIVGPAVRNEFGELTPAATTDYRVWLTRVDSPAERDTDPAGVRPVVQGRFRVRWFRELAEADIELGHILVVDDDDYRVTGIDEVDARDVRGDEQRALRTRRRWLELTTTRTEPA